MSALFARALFAFVALPGVVAFAIPLWGLSQPDGVVHRSGFIVVAIGTTVLVSCVRDFYVAGKGTLAPWAPPRRVVTVGLYRYSRNPMYVGVIMILAGWAVLFESWAHSLYTLLVMVAFYVRVVFFEEPWLARTHGQAWDAYRDCVRRRFIW